MLIVFTYVLNSRSVIWSHRTLKFRSSNYFRSYSLAVSIINICKQCKQTYFIIFITKGCQTNPIIVFCLSNVRIWIPKILLHTIYEFFKVLNVWLHYTCKIIDFRFFLELLYHWFYQLLSKRKCLSFPIAYSHLLV